MTLSETTPQIAVRADARPGSVLAAARSRIPLLLILAAALSLRLTFFTGLVHVDELAYARAANALSHGSLAAGVGEQSTVTVNGDVLNTAAYGTVVRRLATFAPTALAYRFFGVGDVTTAVWPLFCSMATLVLVYLVTRELAGPAAASFAAMLWAILPLDISVATNLLPDGPLAMFSTGAVFAFFKGDTQRDRHAYAWYGASAVCLIGAILAKQTGLITGMVIVLLSVFRWKRRSAIAGAGVAAAVSALMFYYHYKLSGMWLIGKHSGFQSPWIHGKDLTVTAIDWFVATIRAPEFVFILPVAIVAIAVRLTGRRRGDILAALWLGASFLYLEIGTKDPFMYEPFTTELVLRYSVFAMVPCVALMGSYFAERFDAGRAAWTAAAVGVFAALLAWAGSRGSPTLAAWVLQQEDWARPFAAVSSVAAIGAIYGGIASPLFVTGARSASRIFATVALLVSIAVASLHPSYEVSTKYRLPYAETTAAAVSYLATRPDVLWLAQNGTLADRLDYQSGFRRGYDAADPRRGTKLRVVPATPEQIGSAYVFVDETAFTIKSHIAAPGPAYLASPPPTWWEMAAFGSVDGYRLRVYRVLTAEDAGRELREAQGAYAANPNSRTLQRLNGAKVNAGDYCEVARGAWASRTTVPGTGAADLVPRIAACYALDPTIGGPNLLANADFEEGLNGWTRPSAPAVHAEVRSDATEHVLTVTAGSADQRAIILQGARLQPSTPYVFEAAFKTTAPIVALYWESDVGRFDSEMAFPQWTTRRYVFITPPWDGHPRPATIIPFLLDGPGTVQLKSVKLAQLNLD